MSFILAFALTVLTKLPRFIREAIMPDMLIPPISNDPSKIQLNRTSHVYFEHPNLSKFSKFAADFGFVEADRGLAVWRLLQRRKTSLTRRRSWAVPRLEHWTMPQVEAGLLPSTGPMIPSFTLSMVK
jgi:hypothetical protein